MLQLRRQVRAPLKANVTSQGCLAVEACRLNKHGRRPGRRGETQGHEQNRRMGYEAQPKLFDLGCGQAAARGSSQPECSEARRGSQKLSIAAAGGGNL